MGETQRTALVLGVTGGIGAETAAALARHGWRIRAMARKGRPTGSDDSYDWVTGDAMDAGAVADAARGVQAIVHAVNPAGYKNWAGLVVPMVENTIAAAKTSGARILLPGTIYNYGTDAFPVLHEDSHQHAKTHKGRIRVELEQKLETAAQQGVASLILRLGDFFGPKPGNNWFSQALVKPGIPVTRLVYPGAKGVGHTWCYLPDAGETFAQLMEREDELAIFERFHFRGHWDVNGTEMIAAVREAVGNDRLPVRSFPWWLIGLASPFNETLREIYATRPLWHTPVQLDNTKLVRFLGKEPHIPLVDAVRTTLRGIGCIS
ncbi:MAG: NAD-dependent epimerase/dehydratase family protein [Terriglobus sp.]